jgi:hypothetical protein
MGLGLALTLMVLVLAEEYSFDRGTSKDPETDNVKMSACVNLSKAAINAEEDLILRAMKSSILDSDKTLNKIAADMIIACYSRINR